MAQEPIKVADDRPTRRHVLGLGGGALAFSSLFVRSTPTLGGLSGNSNLVVDSNTGYAIYGYDPVAYFDQGDALTGVDGMELRWQGVYWRFLHEGNRAAFKSNPEIYAPRFGGHDPLQLARGYTVEGSPIVWIILLDRLYFFQSIVNLRIWETHPHRYLSEAEHNWGRLRVDSVGIPDPALNRLFGSD